MTPARRAAQAVCSILEPLKVFQGGVKPGFNTLGVPASCVVVPGDPWLEYADMPFCGYSVRLDAVLTVAGSVDAQVALEWFECRANDMHEAFQSADSPDVDGVQIEAVSTMTEFDGPAGSVYQVVVALTPMLIREAE